MVCHHSASLMMPIGDPRDGFFYPTFILMIDSYIHRKHNGRAHAISQLTTSAISQGFNKPAQSHQIFLYPPQTLFVVGYTVFTLSVRVCVRPSVTFCFFNNLKSHCWIFIKPCKHVHICKTNTLDKKVRARGQFY